MPAGQHQFIGGEQVSMTGPSPRTAVGASRDAPHLAADQGRLRSPHFAPVAGPELDADVVPPRPYSPASRLVVLAIISAFAGCASLAIDIRLSRYFFENPLPGFPRDVVRFCEAFGQGAGVCVILATAFALAPRQRRAIVHTALAVTGAGLAANLAKLGVERCRPRAFAFALSDDVWDTFRSSFALPPASSSSLMSFPSAHSATAAALAVMLAWAFPRGRWAFAAIALLACLQRLSSSAHFLSDVLIGAALGILYAVAYQAVRVRVERRLTGFLLSRNR